VGSRHLSATGATIFAQALQPLDRTSEVVRVASDAHHVSVSFQRTTVDLSELPGADGIATPARAIVRIEPGNFVQPLMGESVNVSATQSSVLRVSSPNARATVFNITTTTLSARVDVLDGSTLVAEGVRSVAGIRITALEHASSVSVDLGSNSVVNVTELPGNLPDHAPDDGLHAIAVGKSLGGDTGEPVPPVAEFIVLISTSRIIVTSQRNTMLAADSIAAIRHDPRWALPSTVSPCIMLFCTAPCS
jgi:hypothetical protein